MSLIPTDSSFCMTGTDIDSFFYYLEKLTEMTKAVSVQGKNIGFKAILSPKDADSIAEISNIFAPNDSYDTSRDTIMERIKKADDRDYFSVLSGRSGVQTKLRTMPKTSFAEKGISEQCMRDLEESKLILQFPDEECEVHNHIVMPFCISTILTTLGIKGKLSYSNSFFRNFAIAQGLRTNRKCKVIVRHHEGDYIIIGFGTEMFEYTPQTCLKTIYDDFVSKMDAHAECRMWSIDHQFTDVQFTFPTIADDFTATYGLPEKVIPGIELRTSDSGDSALYVQAFWMIGDHMVRGKSVNRVHRGTYSVAEFIDRANRYIFPEYTILPERLAELMKIGCTDPKAAITYAFDKVKLESVVCKRTVQKLENELASEFIPGVSYTMYDIAVSMMSAPHRVANLCDINKREMEEKMKAAVFVDFSCVPKEEPDEEDSLILTA